MNLLQSYLKIVLGCPSGKISDSENDRYCMVSISLHVYGKLAFSNSIAISLRIANEIFDTREMDFDSEKCEWSKILQYNATT